MGLHACPLQQPVTSCRPVISSACAVFSVPRLVPVLLCATRSWGCLRQQMVGLYRRTGLVSASAPCPCDAQLPQMDVLAHAGCFRRLNSSRFFPLLPCQPPSSSCFPRAEQIQPLICRWRGSESMEFRSLGTLQLSSLRGSRKNRALFFYIIQLFPLLGWELTFFCCFLHSKWKWN